ncbi:MAG: hypothetical protein ACE5F1_13795, partial [Planctomycetota bacterium]
MNESKHHTRTRECVFVGLLAAGLVPFDSCREVSAAAVKTIELGKRPPGYSTRLKIPLQALGEQARLQTIASSCGCLDAKLLADGKPVDKGGSVGPDQDLELEALFRPNTPSPGQGLGRPTRETLRPVFRLGEKGQVAFTWEVNLVCEIVPALSLVSDRSSLRVRLDVPIRAHALELDLQRPIDTRAIVFEEADWIALTPGSPAMTSKLRLTLGPVETTGQRQAILNLPLGPNEFERIALELDARASQTFRPELVQASV